MKVEIVPFQDKYSHYFYDLNYDWLNEYFYVEEYEDQQHGEDDRDPCEDSDS